MTSLKPMFPGMHALLGAVLVGVSLGAPALAAPSAPAFDALAAQLAAEPPWAMTLQTRTDRFDRLQALLPPDDATRALRYRALRCGAERPANPGPDDAAAQALLSRARAWGDVQSEIRLRYCGASFLVYVRDDSSGIAGYTAGIELARRHRLPALLGEGLVLRALTHSAQGAQAAALIDLLQAQRMFEQAGLGEHARHNLLAIAMAYRRMGDYPRALQYIQRADAARPAEGEWSFTYDTLLQRGYLLFDRGDSPASLLPLQEAVTLAVRHRDPQHEAIARVALGASLTRTGALDEALAQFAQAEPPLEASKGAGGNLDLLRLRRGEALAVLGRHREALADYARAQPGLARAGNLRHLNVLHRAQATSLEAIGDEAGALDAYRRFVATGADLERRTRTEQDALLRHQFDADRLEFEHQRLLAQKTLQERQMDAAMYERRWQRIALATGLLLLGLLVGLGVHQLRRLRWLRVLAMTDSLTGIANRRRLERFAEESLAAAQREGGTIAALALDIDHFKPINDRHGHAVGDEVLRRVAKCCQGTLREFDLLGRTGGEEFVIVLPRTAIEPARRVAERLRESVEALDLSDLAPGLAVTVSIGGAQSRHGEHDVGRVLHRADVALYQAKQHGRNRVEFDDSRFEPAPLPDDVVTLPVAPPTSGPARP